MFCSYGCGQTASYQLKNGKWCCSDYYTKCPKIREKNSKGLLGRKHSKETKNKISKKLKERIGCKTNKRNIKKKCKYCGTEDESKFNFRKNYCCLTVCEDCYKIKKIETGKKISKTNKSKGINHWTKTKEVRNKIRNTLIGKKMDSKKYKEKYPLFAKIEKIRDNNDKNFYSKNKPNIQVKCKFCGNWFTPKLDQLNARISHLENEDGNGGSYFYCSDDCKQECPLYYLRSDPFKSTKLPYTQSEYQIWRTEVFKRQLDEYGFNFCEYCESIENLEAHHIEPVKLQPGLSLDPENGLVCCKRCHLNKAHVEECSTGQLSNIICEELT